LATLTETQLRLFFFIAILVLVAVWELASPQRRLTVSKAGRWFNNLGIIFLDSLLVRLIFPLATMGVAAAAQEAGWGLFNLVALPAWLTVLLAVLVLDLVIYLQHVMFHAVPALWRVHMVHHADLDFDVTTGLRFHPIEIIVSMLIKMATVAALGPPLLAVFIFEIALNGTAMFNHGNIRLPTGLDRILRLLVVTPDMHRVHHSVLIRETNSNFGFNFPWWDRLFGTYRSQPVAGHQEMVIGLSQFRKKEEVTLFRLLLLPFIGQEGRYSLKYNGKNPEIISKSKKRTRESPKN
jgi:sterol desaturase/sphingolipid hydroxylase (fatty acid hydroxylase superfamily)